MGLFIGASLLTILEILDYLCEVGENPRCHGEESGHQCLKKGDVGYLTPATCPQVFHDRVLGYFWNRRSSQRRSGNSLVTLPLSPSPSVVGLTPTLNIWSRSYGCSSPVWFPPDSPSSHSSRKS